MSEIMCLYSCNGGKGNGESHEPSRYGPARTCWRRRVFVDEMDQLRDGVYKRVKGLWMERTYPCRPSLSDSGTSFGCEFLFGLQIVYLLQTRLSFRSDHACLDCQIYFYLS